MKKISEADLKRAIVAVEAERAKHPSAFRPDRTQRASLRKGRRASDRMVTAFLKEAGLDLAKFEALQEQRSADLARMVEAQKADALRVAKQRNDTLHSSIVAQSTALRDLAGKTGFFPHPAFSLDKPFLIWSTPLIDVDSEAVAFGSWAKFKYATSARKGTQKIGFYFYWANNFNDYAVISAATFMSATGHLKAHAPWTWNVNTSEVDAYAQLALWYGWPTGVTSTDADVWYLGGIRAYGSNFTGGDTEGRSISAGVSLNQTMFAIPPGSVVVFEVALVLAYDNDDGDIEADFASGNFNITCPVVVFSLLNTPPGMVNA